MPGTIEFTTHPKRARYRAPDGTLWSLYDRVYVHMKGWSAFVAPSPEAEHRVFVPAKGVRMVYEFAPGESRALSPAALDRQLNAAERMETDEGTATDRQPW